jgi:hypothetical protein
MKCCDNKLNLDTKNQTRYNCTLLASTGQLQQDVEELVISRSAIRRARMKHRELCTSEIKTSFDPAVPLVLHWDGKIMEDFTGPGRDPS